MQKKTEEFIALHGLRCNETARYTDLVSEVGELGKEILKGTDYGKRPYVRTPGAAAEAGDCLFSLLALCTELGIDAEDALDSAIEKYRLRFSRKGSADSGK